MKQKFGFLVIVYLLLTVDFGYGKRLLTTVPPIFAQKLVDKIIKKNPDMLDVLFHVTPTGAKKNIVIASYLTKSIGELSGNDDLGVMNSGKPLIEVQKDGIRIGVLVQLRDSKGNAIGALGLMYPYVTGQDQAKVLARSNAIRDNIQKQIKNVNDLFIKQSLS